jgi:glycosyltransferase involved in cell wall biosynthesis
VEKISVIIPTYNRSGKLRGSVESVLRQTYTDFELLIVDDGSQDDTREVVKAMAIEDDRIRYIRQEINQGASAARNEGVRQAKNPLIAFQDSDDMWRRDKLEKQMIYLNRHPKYAMIYCPVLVHEGQGHRVPDEDWTDLEGQIFPRLLLHNTIDTPAMLIRRECFLETGGFDTGLRAHEDWDFALRFSRKYEIGYVNEVLVDSYCSPGGISSGVSAYYESRCRMIARYKEQMLQYGVFDTVVGEVLSKAEHRGILQEVKKMLLYFLQWEYGESGKNE